MKNLKFKYNLEELFANNFMKVNLPRGTFELITKVFHFQQHFWENTSTEQRKKWSTDLISAKRSGEDPDENWVERFDEQHDAKTLFQYRKTSLKKLTSIPMSHMEQEWMYLMDHLHGIGEEVTKSIFADVVKKFPELELYKFQTRAHENQNHVLRTLLYQPEKERYAKEHIDMSFGTLAYPDLGDCDMTYPALHIEGENKLIEHNKDEAIFFFGLKGMILSDISLRTAENNFISALTDESWIGKFSKFQAPVHWADNPGEGVIRKVPIHFMHTMPTWELSELSKVQKRITRSRGFNV